ncbi:MAG: phage tail tape measure protein [Gemmiger formicilis]|uniref:phage tail tape measure protein n=1 Tax=Gemmiger formicilis TaxID=745368 RepID=UPI003FEDB4E0|nr:phage tail tape measure protein [Gemmiger formicilis]
MAKQSLASAYVQIIPSADGISGRLAEVMGGEAASAGEISGKSLGSALVGSLTKVVAAAGIGKMLQSAFTGGTAFESAMAKVGTIADTAKVPLESLSSQVLQVSGDMHIGANEIAEAAYQAISAGQDTGNAVAFAGQASMLATAGFTSSASAVDILTTALNAYGKGADEAGHVSDVLLTTQNLGKTSVDELAGSMGRVIPLAAAYNVSLENLSSGLAIMTANGIATAEASTYIKSMLNELGDTGSDVGEILQQQTGQSFAELNADGKSLGDVLQVLYDSVGGNATKFAGLWHSVEAGTGALSLASSGADKFNGVLQQMQADSGATQTAYDTMTDTMAYKLDGVKTNAQNLGTALFNAVSGRLGEGVALAGGYLQTLSESVQQNGIAGLAEGLAAVFTDLTTNVGPQLLQTGINLLGKLGEGLVTGIPQLLAQALPVVANLASGLRENAGQLVDAGIQFILNLAIGLMDGLPTMIAYLPGIVSDIVGIINDNAPKLLVAGVQLIITLGQGLIQAIPTLVENIPQILMAVANVITAFNWLNLGGNIIKLLGDGIKGMKGALTSGFKSVLDGGINYIKSLPAKFIEWGKDMIMGLVKGITGSVGAVVGAVKNVASTIATYIHFSRPDVGPLRLYEQWMPDFMSGLAKGIRDNLWMVEDAAGALALTTAKPMQLQVAGVLRGNQQTAAASWQPQPGVAYQQTNNFYTHDSLSESELTREAEDMMNRLRWGIP